MEFKDRKLLNNLSYKLMTEAILKIDELGLRQTAIIPFCIMMLETTLTVLNQSKVHNEQFRKDNPENLVDEALVQTLTMFSVAFGIEVERFVEHGRKNKDEISKEVDEFLKNLPKKGENNETDTRRDSKSGEGSKESDQGS